MFKLGGSANTHGVGLTSGLKMNKGGRVGFQPGGLASRGIQPGAGFDVPVQGRVLSGGQILNALLSGRSPVTGDRGDERYSAAGILSQLGQLPEGTLFSSPFDSFGRLDQKTFDQFLEANPSLASEFYRQDYLRSIERDGLGSESEADFAEKQFERFKKQEETPYTMEQIRENPFIGDRVGDYIGTEMELTEDGKSIDDLIAEKKKKDELQRFLELTGGFQTRMPEDEEFKESDEATLGQLENVFEKAAKGAIPDRLQKLQTPLDIDVSDLKSTLPTEEEKRIAELTDVPEIDSTKEFTPTTFEDLTASPKDIETADEKEKEEIEDAFNFEEEVRQRKEILSDLFEDENMATRAAELLLKSSAPLLKGEGFGAAAEAAGDVLSSQAKQLRDVKNAVTTQSIKDITAKEARLDEAEIQKDLLDRSIEFKEKALLANIQLGQQKILSNEQLQLMGIKSNEAIQFAQMQNQMARDELKAMKDENLQRMSQTTQIYLAEIQNDTAKQNLLLNQNFQRELSLFDAQVDLKIAQGKIDATEAMAEYEAVFEAALDGTPRPQDFVTASRNKDVLNMPTYTYGEKMGGKEDGDLITDANIFQASQDIKVDQLMPNQMYVFNGKFYFTDENGDLQGGTVGSGTNDIDAVRNSFLNFQNKQ
tara:strand:+ start:43 stop:1995 length:1953 start_codon:yes stop_codon:yes gene_type:complete